MINIRYHIVSITAIFLALGIGTLLGSTFLDRATVDQLDRNITNAEQRIADTEAANRRFEEQVDRNNRRDLGLIAASETILDGQLTDRPVLLVVAPGVDQGTVDNLRLVLANADADLRGSLMLRDDLTFVDGVDEGVADALGLDPDDVDAARAEVAGQLVAALAGAGAPAESDPTEEPGDDGPGAGTTTTVAEGPSTTAPGETTTTTAPAAGSPSGGGDAPVPDGDEPEIVRTLLDADLVTLDPGPAYTPDDPILERTGYRYVYVAQPDLDPAADELLLSLLPPTETDPPLPAVVVSSSVPEPEGDSSEAPPTTAVAQVRADAGRSELYDTVDDVDTFLGLSSTVTILRADEGTAAGHYGQGEGATALAPAGR